MKLAEPKNREWIDGLEDQLRTWKIILFNDEVNSFEDVIVLLVTYCKHTIMQAEQCAMIVHSSGKYAVKEGGREELEDIANVLAENGLTVEIQ